MTGIVLGVFLHQSKEENVLVDNSLSHLIYGIRYMVKDHSAEKTPDTIFNNQ